MSPVVVKVGGSLYDLAGLGARLASFLAGCAAPVLLVPGGGQSADAIRELDRIHRLGDEASHWLALRACSLNGHFLAHLLGGLPVVADVPAPAKLAVVDLFAFAIDDERRPDHWPHRWDVASDSMALRVANVALAAELILLKSIDVLEVGDWSVAAATGGVDPFFPTAMRLTPGVAVRAVNFRTRREGAT